jgi:subtilisin
MAKSKRGASQFRFVVLPTQGLRFDAQASSAPTIRAMSAMSRAVGDRWPVKRAEKRSEKVKVLESARENGLKLIEATPDELLAFKEANPGVRVVPEVFYYPALAPRAAIVTKASALAVTAHAAVTVKVISSTDSAPIDGAMVVAFTNFSQGIGAQGETNKQGKVKLQFGGPFTKLERVYVYPQNTYCSSLMSNVRLTDGSEIKLRPIDLNATDCVRHFYSKPPAGSKLGKGVVVGVIDSGIDLKHPDLKVAGGFNTVVGEKPKDYGDNGTEGHGTHVGGIIAARGTPPSGIRGVAPDVELRSFRVFGKGQAGASNFAIAAAIDEATTQGCDLLNLSLGGGPTDAALHAAISDARQKGVALIIAAGNDGRAPVSNPANDALAIAVSAMGVKGTFPGGTTQEGDIARPFGKDPDEFIAAFSNIGPEIDATGPGVGVISTVPAGYGVMSGTSMACPAVTGALARLLSDNAKILKVRRDAPRSQAILQLLFTNCLPRGFGPDYEGHGLPK